MRVKFLFRLKSPIVALITFGLFTACASGQTDRSNSVVIPSPREVIASDVTVDNGQFISKTGKFQVSIAEIPSQTLDLGSETARAKGIDVGKQYVWRFENTLYTIYYTPPVDREGNTLPNVFEDMVSGSRKGVLRSNGKIISEKPYMFQGFNGVELRYTSAEGLNFVSRLFISGDFGYQVVGAYLGDKEMEVLDILNSFATRQDRSQKK